MLRNSDLVPLSLVTIQTIRKYFNKMDLKKQELRDFIQELTELS